MKKKVLRYIAVCSIGYSMLFTITYLLVEQLDLRAGLSYGIAISLVYIWTYVANTLFVFEVGLNRGRMMKYLLYLLGSWFVNNLLFNVLVSLFGLYYVAAILINIIFLSIVRFIVQKKFIFN